MASNLFPSPGDIVVFNNFGYCVSIFLLIHSINEYGHDSKQSLGCPVNFLETSITYQIFFWLFKLD